jgi:hypothetical protein
LVTRVEYLAGLKEAAAADQANRRKQAKKALAAQRSVFTSKDKNLQAQRNAALKVQSTLPQTLEKQERVALDKLTHYEVLTLIVAREGKLKHFTNKKAAVAYLRSVLDRPPTVGAEKLEQITQEVVSLTSEIDRNATALRAWDEQNPNWEGENEDDDMETHLSQEEADEDGDDMDLAEEESPALPRALNGQFSEM